MDQIPIPQSGKDALQNEQEGVAMTTSPTGTPKVAPRSVPWLLALIVGLGAGAGVCAAKTRNEDLRTLCEVGVAVTSGVLGVISPGLRAKDGAQ